MKLKERYLRLHERWDRVSIRWHLLSYLAIFVVLMLAVIWIFQIAFLDTFYRANQTRRIEESAELLADNIDNGNLLETALQVAQNNNTCIRIVDEKLVDRLDINMNDSCIIHRLSTLGLAQYYYEAQESKNGVVLDQFEGAIFGQNTPPHEDGVQSIVYVKLVQAENGSTYMILLNSVLSPIGATVDTLQTQFFWIVGIFLLLCVVLAFLLSRRISKPIVQINQSAKELAKGRYDTTFTGGGYLEIAELRETLNYAAQELSKVEGLRREFIANVSHDLRTPLTMITGYGEVMRDLPGENTPENVQIIIDEAKRLTSLVNNILDISKLQSGNQELNLTCYNLTEDIARTLSRYAKLREQEGYQIHFQCDQQAWVQADAMRMGQVLYNLVNNAITYTGEDRKVLVRQQVKNGWVCVQVMDTGEGIPEDQLPLIWDQYYKFKSNHHRAVVGTGLGLSIVKGILELHHARYGVESTLGKGSTFWFSLPVVDPPEPAQGDISPDGEDTALLQTPPDGSAGPDGPQQSV